jgi:putative spermidine/putrescine transport system permease protein
MWDGINEALDPTMAAVAAVLIAVTVSLLCADAYVRSRRAN